MLDVGAPWHPARMSKRATVIGYALVLTACAAPVRAAQAVKDGVKVTIDIPKEGS